jgi:hypothetical protein
MSGLSCFTAAFYIAAPPGETGLLAQEGHDATATLKAPAGKAAGRSPISIRTIAHRARPWLLPEQLLPRIE